jgi:hypothetical protein
MSALSICESALAFSRWVFTSDIHLCVSPNSNLARFYSFPNFKEKAEPCSFALNPLRFTGMAFRVGKMR